VGASPGVRRLGRAREAETVRRTGRGGREDGEEDPDLWRGRLGPEDPPLTPGKTPLPAQRPYGTTFRGRAAIRPVQGPEELTRGAVAGSVTNDGRGSAGGIERLVGQAVQGLQSEVIETIVGPGTGLPALKPGSGANDERGR
jgi:hypothetical protein